MRLLVLILLFLIIITVFAIVYADIMNIFIILDEQTNILLNNMSHILKTNYTKINILDELKPYLALLDTTLGIAIIVFLAGIFYYSRKR
jgi:hypothetical protein